jgi:hypothetical protein
MKKIHFVGFALTLMVIGIAGQSDFEEAVQQETLYCESVRLWENDAARGVAPEHRAGWPPFNPDVSCAEEP